MRGPSLSSFAFDCPRRATRPQANVPPPHVPPRHVRDGQKPTRNRGKLASKALTKGLPPNDDGFVKATKIDTTSEQSA